MIASDLNKELGRYLHSRRKDEKRRTKTRPKKVAEEVPEDLEDGEVRIFKRQPNFWSRWFGTGDEEEELVREDLTPEEMGRLERMQEQLKRIGGAEFKDVELSYVDKDTSFDFIVEVPEYVVQATYEQREADDEKGRETTGSVLTVADVAGVFCQVPS